jgi:ferredoxin
MIINRCVLDPGSIIAIRWVWILATLLSGLTGFLGEGQCFGCGVCVDKCQNNLIVLNLDPQKGVPLEIEKLMKEAISVG